MSFSVSVPHRDLKAALKALKVVKPKNVPEAIFSFSDGELEIVLSGVTARASAVGTWPGTVRVDGRFLLGLSHSVPTSDPLLPMLVSVQEGRLKIAGVSCLCTVEQGVQQSVIRLSINAPLHERLYVKQVHSDDEIASSGWMKPVQQAAEERDKLIARAAEVLQPLAVEANDLMKLVDDCIRRKNTK